MKKIVHLITFCIVILATWTCKKERIFPIERNGIVYWTGSTQVDGCDWVILIDNESYHPENLSNDFKIDSLQVKVKYRLLSKKKDFLCSISSNLKSIRIKSISKR